LTWVPRFVIARALEPARAVVRTKGAERTAYLRAKLGVLRAIVRERDVFRGDGRERGALAVYEANRTAGRRYLPGPYHGPVVLCLTADRPIVGARDFRLDWLDRVPQAGAAEYVGGRDSVDMGKLPHVVGLARRIDVWLAQARSSVTDARIEPARGHPEPLLTD
jgi:hypothetical protein